LTDERRSSSGVVVVAEEQQGRVGGGGRAAEEPAGACLRRWRSSSSVAAAAFPSRRGPSLSRGGPLSGRWCTPTAVGNSQDARLFKALDGISAAIISVCKREAWPLRAKTLEVFSQNFHLCQNF